MDKSIDKLRGLVRQNKYSVRQHAHQRMLERDIFIDDIETVVLLGEVIEENPNTTPCPTSLFMRFIKSQPLYAVCALSQDWVYIITVYWYDPKKWINPWTRNK